MRILSFLFKSILFFGILAAFVYFAGGYIWLRLALGGFLDDVKRLPQMARSATSYKEKCQSVPEASSNSYPVAFQIRFLNDREYVVEVVCSLIENSPQEISKSALPLGISKLTGSAGLVFYIDHSQAVESAVALVSLRSRYGVSLSGDVVTANATIGPEAGSFPRTECRGFGFFCCNTGAQAGIGSAISEGVTDCPGACFSACTNLPFAKVFASDPPFEPQTRTVTMTSNSQDFVFNYATNLDANIGVHIDFGDGSSQDSSQAEGIFSHTYACTGSCKYTVSLKITDSVGHTSVENENTKIYIKRQ